MSRFRASIGTRLILMGVGSILATVVTLVGGTVTIFQRTNAQGDTLHVATNVTKPDGTRAIGSIATVSQQNSAAAQQVTTSSEEMSAQVEEVGASAQSLAEMARALQEVVSQFRLTDERYAVGRGSPSDQPGRAAPSRSTGGVRDVQRVRASAMG